MPVAPVLDFPLYVYWNVTSRCNLRCAHCLSDSGAARKGEMSYSQGVALIDEMAANRAFFLYLSGGEPFLRPDLLELIERARAYGISVSLATNGVFVTPEKAGHLKSLGVAEVMVSLDGPDAASHDAFRGVPGTFHAALRALEILRAQGLRTAVSTMVRPEIIPLLSEIHGLVAQRGAHAWRLSGTCPVGRGRELYAEIGLSAGEIHHLARYVAETTSEGGSVAVFLEDPLPMKSWGLEGRISLRPATCMAGRVLCCVQSDGTVTPCVLFDLPMGSLKQQTLKEIWQSSETVLKLRAVSPATLQGRCALCPKVSSCNGGCRAHSWSEYGDVFASDPVCLDGLAVEEGS